MRKALAFLLISSLLLIPLAAFADNVGVVRASLYFEAVVNMWMDVDWETVTITQPDIDEYFDYAEVDMPIPWGAPPAKGYNIKVGVQALSSFNVYAGYSSNSANFETLVGTENSFIALKDLLAGTVPSYIDYVAAASLPAFTNLNVPPPSPPGWDTGTHSETDGAVSALFTLLPNWSGANNMPAGEDRTYDVHWNPQELTGDFKSTDQLDIDIYFLVTDPTV